MASDSEQWAEDKAEELLECDEEEDGYGEFLCLYERGEHDSECPAHHRPAVARELARLAEQVEQARAERDEAVKWVLEFMAAMDSLPGWTVAHTELWESADQWLAALDEEASDG